VAHFLGNSGGWVRCGSAEGVGEQVWRGDEGLIVAVDLNHRRTGQRTGHAMVRDTRWVKLALLA
jgi:hypothetical protein